MLHVTKVAQREVASLGEGRRVYERRGGATTGRVFFKGDRAGTADRLAKEVAALERRAAGGEGGRG